MTTLNTRNTVVDETNVAAFAMMLKAGNCKVLLSNEERFIVAERSAAIGWLDNFTVLEDLANNTPTGLQRLVGKPLAGYTTVDRIIEIDDDWFVRQVLIDEGVVATHYPKQLMDVLCSSARGKVLMAHAKLLC